MYQPIQLKTKDPSLGNSISRSLVAIITLVCGTLASVEIAHADIITVMNTNDSGPGSLRQALADANDLDMINFNSSLRRQTITLTSGQLLVNKSVTIIGLGADNLSVSGNASSTVFRVAVGGPASISGLTVTNGYALGIGGGIYNSFSSTLTVNNCTISGNSATGNSATGGFGGGILNTDGSTLTVNNCTISGNSAIGGVFAVGGGVYNQELSTLTIINSTISGNSAIGGLGGGIFNESATLTITNSTISGNSVGVGGGGGIYNNSAALIITNSTISGNSAIGGVGGGIYNESAIVTITDSILNSDGLGTNIYNISGTITSLGYNLSDDNGSGFLTGPGDQITTDPLLGPLQNNGGPTFTHALLPGSPAIDAGDPSFTPPPFFDQRGPGFYRVVNGRTDIGSFEAQGPPPVQRPSPTRKPHPTPAPRP